MKRSAIISGSLFSRSDPKELVASIWQNLERYLQEEEFYHFSYYSYHPKGIVLTGRATSNDHMIKSESRAEFIQDLQGFEFSRGIKPYLGLTYIRTPGLLRRYPLELRLYSPQFNSRNYTKSPTRCDVSKLVVTIDSIDYLEEESLIPRIYLMYQGLRDRYLHPSSSLATLSLTCQTNLRGTLSNTQCGEIGFIEDQR